MKRERLSALAPPSPAPVVAPSFSGHQAEPFYGAQIPVIESCKSHNISAWDNLKVVMDIANIENRSDFSWDRKFFLRRFVASRAEQKREIEFFLRTHIMEEDEEEDPNAADWALG